MAQMDKAPAYEVGDCRFESCSERHKPHERDIMIGTSTPHQAGDPETDVAKSVDADATVGEVPGDAPAVSKADERPPVLGFKPFPKRGDGVVTSEQIHRLQDELDEIDAMEAAMEAEGLT